MSFNWLQAAGLFVAAALLDGIYALYTVAVVKNRAFAAAGWSFLSYILLAIGILSFVDNKKYVIPLALGAFVGSYSVVKREALKKQK